MDSLPGGPLAKRPLHMYWVCDVSGSMKGDKIQSLNQAARDAIRPTQDVAARNPNAEVFVSVLAFSSGFRWTARNTPLGEFRWNDLSADGVTELGGALQELARQFTTPPMPSRGLRPVVVLVSDGKPTDDFEAGLESVLGRRWGQLSIRIAIAIGKDAHRATLRKFVGSEEIPVLTARNPEALGRYIRWASTTALRVSTTSRLEGAAGMAPPLPESTPAGPEVW